MKKYIFLFVFIAILTALFSGCADNQTPQPSVSHPDGWVQASSKEGHGEKVLTSGLTSCTSCHGDDFSGGESKVSCFKCHASYPHLDGWLLSTNDKDHGVYLGKKDYATTECQTCHGQDLQGGGDKKPCTQCHALYPHETNWNKVGDEKFHGAYAQSVNWNLASCKTCHGQDLQGGAGKASCNTCHKTYPHNAAWLQPDNPAYHGAYLAAVNFNATECKSCHGEDLQGGDGKKSCNACHDSYPHSTSFKSETASNQFHGPYLKAKSYDLTECASCHGADYAGSSSKASCFKCHTSYPHGTTWLNPADTQSHVGYLRSHRHNLQECQTCHGADYKGGTSDGSCFTCHNSATGPEACDLCHGSKANFAPPKDTQGNTAITALGVGRHQFHVVDKKYSCVICHTVPTTFASPGHVYDDNTPGHAEINSLWQWNNTTASCVTGCHSNDPSKNYIWNH